MRAGKKRKPVKWDERFCAHCVFRDCRARARCSVWQSFIRHERAGLVHVPTRLGAAMRKLNRVLNRSERGRKWAAYLNSLKGPETRA